MPVVSHATAQGDRREQQDRHVITRVQPRGLLQSYGQLLAIMDGHGGIQTAQILTDTLALTLQTCLESNKGRVEPALRETFHQLHKRTKSEDSGSSLSMVYIPEDTKHAHAAVLGDSPVAILDNHGALHIGPVHNARINLIERAKAESKGAIYSGGYLEDPRVRGHGLQLSRSFGDRGLARILNREPEFFTVLLGPGSFVFLASDGIFDPEQIDFKMQIRKFATQAQSGWGPDRFVNDALGRQTGDNVTVIIWKA